jgi:hypothetical protein
MDSRNSKNTGYGLYHILGFITKKKNIGKAIIGVQSNSPVQKTWTWIQTYNHQKISTKGRKLQNVCLCKNKTLLKNAGDL